MALGDNDGSSIRRGLTTHGKATPVQSRALSALSLLAARHGPQIFKRADVLIWKRVLAFLAPVAVWAQWMPHLGQLFPDAPRQPEFDEYWGIDTKHVATAGEQVEVFDDIMDEVIPPRT